MEKITYGAPRLVDWVAQIKVGAASVRVHFTGGALTSYGVTPAEYTTSNPFIQKVIENSSYFKEGRIIVQRRIMIEEPRKPALRGKPKVHPAPQQASAPQPNAEETVAKFPATAPASVEVEEPETVDLTKVEVTCLPDAQGYLQENFNISSYKVRSCEIAQKIAAEHGIQFTGGKFDTLICDKKVEDEAEGGE
ncbi:MAG: hypothetical protein J6K19_03900 [Prevotella sp.]|nr:hypothetical protein [Prevotella sp.]